MSSFSVKVQVGLVAEVPLRKDSVADALLVGHIVLLG